MSTSYCTRKTWSEATYSYLLRCPEENKAKAGHSGQANVIAHVRHRHVQQTTDGAVIGGPAVRHTDGIHRAVPQDRVAVARKLFDDAFSGLLLAVKVERRAACENLTNGGKY